MRKDGLIILLLLFVVLSACKPTFDDVFVYGLVQDKLSGKWLGKVVISSDSILIGNVITGSDGYFAFTIPATKKTINLTASKQNYESVTQILNVYELSKNPNKSIDFQLLRASIIYTGNVMDADTQLPIPNAKIHAKIQNGSYIGAVETVFTDSSGAYTIELPKPKFEAWKYYITANASGYDVQTYTLSHSQTDMGKDFVLNFYMQTNSN